MDGLLNCFVWELLAIVALASEISSYVHPRHRDLHEDYLQHQTLRPLVYTPQDPLKTPLTSSQTKSGHHELLSLSFKAFGRNFFVQLSKNRKLLPSSYIEKYFSENGSEIIERDFDHNVSHCFYHGSLPSSKDESSHAAFSTCDGLSGYISDWDDVYYIEPSKKNATLLSGDHNVFRERDRTTQPLNFSCGHSSIDININSRVHRENINKANRVKRTVRWPYDATPKTKIVELYVVNDHSQYAAFEYKRNAVAARTKEIVNIVSSLYRPIGIYVVLVGIEIWTTRNRIEVVGEAHKTMNNFLEYRRTSICPNHPNDNAQLIIGETLGDGVVGKAPIMTICTWQYSGGVNMDHSQSAAPVGTTLAHEMGHNFGLYHDDTDQTSPCVCADSRCIMASKSGGTRNPTKWSSCSRDQFEEAFLQGMDYCLHNLPSEAQFSARVCGNGFVEDGEECDCGLPQDCDTQCCNALTCKLSVNATCATGECCDLDTCKIRPASFECRPQSQQCDLTEHCNGRSEFCARDVHKTDGHECDREGVASYCYKGKCETHDAQCKKLWGQTGGQSNPFCYSHFNPMGLPNGHCDFSFRTKKFEKCADRDVMCGMLHCDHRNEKLMFWKEALAYTLPEAWVMINETRYDCKAAILDVGLDMPDPGMVPDGAKCAHNKICVSHKCIAIEDLEVQSCPHCHGHGVCNSLGQCHCDAGWGPPYCDVVGRGGSEHSGPVSNNEGSKGLVVGLCLFFFLIFPLLAFLVFIGYRKRETLKKLWARGPGQYRTIYLAKPRNDIEQLPPAARTQPPPQPLTVADQRRHKVPRQPSTNRHSVRTPSFTSRDISSPHLHSSTNRKLQDLPSLSYKNAKGDPAVILGIPEHASPTRPAPPPPGMKQVPPPRPKSLPTKASPQSPEAPQYENAVKFEDVRLDSPPDGDALYCNVSSSGAPPVPPKNIVKRPVPTPKQSTRLDKNPTPASRIASIRQKFSSPSTDDTNKPRWNVSGERPVISDPIPQNGTGAWGGNSSVA